MMARYESRRAAALDLLAALRYRLARQRLFLAYECGECGRTATSVPATRTLSPNGMPCGRRTIRLRRCTGVLIRETAA